MARTGSSVRRLVLSTGVVLFAAVASVLLIGLWLELIGLGINQGPWARRLVPVRNSAWRTPARWGDNRAGAWLARKNPPPLGLCGDGLSDGGRKRFALHIRNSHLLNRTLAGRVEVDALLANTRGTSRRGRAPRAR